MARNIVAELRVEPMGTGSSMSTEVRHAVERMEDEDVRIDVGPMGTSMESTSLDAILNAAKAAHRAVCEHAPRVVTTLTIDERMDDDTSMEERVAEVQ